MPQPIPPSSFNFDDAPGGDFSLDQLFGDNQTQSDPQTPPPTENPTPDPQANPSEPFLKTATGTVYNSVEDAIKGTEHKDALIAQLREQLTKQNGTDPIKAPQPNPQPQIESYSQNPKKYFEDMNKAFESKDEAKILEVQRQFQLENLAPYVPMLTSVAREQARNQVTSEIPEFGKFQGSEQYKQVLEAFPLLKNSIEQAENNPQLAGDLAQLYRMSYDASAGRNVSKIVQENQPPPAAPQVRPTVSSTPIAPPPPTAPPKTEAERRRDVIARMESQGIGDRRF